MTKKIIIANWKMNNSFDEAEIWLHNFSKKLPGIKENLEIVLCPSFILLDYLDGLLMDEELQRLQKLHGNIDELSEDELEKKIFNVRQIHLGGQDCHAEKNGAFTGDVSAIMLKDCGCEYVILGHCERRQYLNESDQLIARKVSAAIDANLTPILCIGESKNLRQNNSYLDFIGKQIENNIPVNLEIDNLIIAYEPVWSIGTGLVPTIKEIEEIAEFIKSKISANKNIKNFAILYGGSVKKENSAEILAINNIDGLLVGGASLKADEFFEIVNA